MAKGVTAMLKAAAGDMQQTEKAQATPTEAKAEEVKTTEEPKEEPPVVEPPKEEPPQTDEEAKHPGGRPSFEETGDTKRQQYTLTLTPDFYNEIKEYRKNHKKRNGKMMSFAEFLETAAIEYMENHE